MAKPEPEGSLQDTAVFNIVATMNGNQIDFSHAALTFLAQGRFSQPSLVYLGMNVRDQETPED